MKIWLWKGRSTSDDSVKFEPVVSIWPILQRYIRFGVVGASGIVVDMGVLFVLSDPRMLGVNLSLGKVVAAEIALISNFIWNELWTFGDISAAQSHWRARLERLVKFNLICAAGICLSIVLLNIQVRLISMNVYAGNLIAILIVSVWNFGMNLKFGWKSRPTDKDVLEKGDVEKIAALKEATPELE